MKVIIPMAGLGKRMRPHTLVTPKPLLTMVSKPIVEHIVSDLQKYSGIPIDEVHYVIGNFSDEVKSELLLIAKNIGAKGFIHYQHEALGTAHAVYCAKDALSGEVIIAFADTIFIGDFSVVNEKCIVWTKEVTNPEQYGVVVTDKSQNILSFVEKPKDLVSNKAIIGIYYFRQAEILKREIEDLIQNKKTTNGEYQLTDALKSLLINKVPIVSVTITEWLDCGNSKEFLDTHHKILNNGKSVILGEVIDSIITDPVFIGKHVKVVNSVIGPHVSIQNNSFILNSSLTESIIGANTEIKNSSIDHSIIGNHSLLNGAKGILNIGDFNSYESN